MTLTEFLLARIAEDEADDRHSTDCLLVSAGAGDGWCTCSVPARHRAECEAKRRIVSWWTAGREGMSPGYDAVQTLCLLALPYADHADYDEAWRP